MLVFEIRPVHGLNETDIIKPVLKIVDVVDVEIRFDFRKQDRPVNDLSHAHIFLAAFRQEPKRLKVFR